MGNVHAEALYELTSKVFLLFINYSKFVEEAAISLLFPISTLLAVFFITIRECRGVFFDLPYLFDIFRVGTSCTVIAAAQKSSKTPLLAERHSTAPFCESRRSQLRIIPIHSIDPFLILIIPKLQAHFKRRTI